MATINKEPTELNLVEMKDEINKHLGDKETFAVLMRTTFKGLEASTAKRAALEGVMRGFTFKDFLEKNLYAVPFKDGYSLVTSIDYARKVGMRSGVVGKSAPTYEIEGKKIISCTITVKRKVNDYVGEYTATVYFDEYSTGKNLWTTKPRTMIAKVAEMHALRMACPEELAQSYVEEEMQPVTSLEAVAIDLTGYEQKLKAVKSLPELQKVWADIPVQAKVALGEVKNEMKAILDTEAKELEHVSSEEIAKGI